MLLASAAAGVTTGVARAAAPFRAPVDKSTRTPNCGFDSQNCAEPGRYHTGTDFNGDATIRATADGIVEVVHPNAGDQTGLGNTVIVRHLVPGGTVYSLYAHMASIGVSSGQCVPQGQALGTMGGSGYGQPNRWDVHSHFEIKNAPTLGPPDGSDHAGYTGTSARQHGYSDPDEYLGKVSTERECGLIFDNPRVLGKRLRPDGSFDLRRGHAITTRVVMRYRGLTPLECGWINLGTGTAGQPDQDSNAHFRNDRAGFFPKSQWRNKQRVAAFGCKGQVQPGGDVEWRPSFRAKRKAHRRKHVLASVFHPVYDAPAGQGSHAALTVGIYLNIKRAKRRH
ncbi:MAG TPA: M23 family metallopeptidase [Thermoleophilaceae bacterium]